MRYILLFGLLFWLIPVPSEAGCIVEGDQTYAVGARLRDDICDTTGAKKIVNMTAFLSSGTKTGDFQVKAGAGFLHQMVCIGTDSSTTAGTIILHDAVTETNPAVFSWTVPAAADLSTYPRVFPLDIAIATGIYLGYTTLADVACTVFYK